MRATRLPFSSAMELMPASPAATSPSNCPCEFMRTARTGCGPQSAPANANRPSWAKTLPATLVAASCARPSRSIRARVTCEAELSICTRTTLPLASAPVSARSCSYASLPVSGVAQTCLRGAGLSAEARPGAPASSTAGSSRRRKRVAAEGVMSGERTVRGGR